MNTKPGQVLMPQGKTLKAVLDQLNHAIKEVNSQLGKLAPGSDPPQVLVAYHVNGFKPRLDMVGGVHLDLKWMTQPPICLQMKEAVENGQDAHVCQAPATHVWRGNYVCADHAPEDSVAIAELMAQAQAKGATS